MATAEGEKEGETVDLKKKNDSLASEVDRLTNLLKQSERKRRKQKVVYEKNMENLSIRLTDFESNLRREQKEIQELMSKKDKQIKVREELTKTLRQKLDQQHCTHCGYPNPSNQSMELDWQLEIDEENDQVIKTLPPLDLPPPEETTNISFTNHRPFRPKSKLSPVAEESEITFSSSLRSIHADLNPDRFHAALTASLNLLNESDGAETPTNSTYEEGSGEKSSSDASSVDVLSSEKISPPELKTPELEGKKHYRQERENGKVLMTKALSSFCDTLCVETMKLVNDKFLKPKTISEKNPMNVHKTSPTCLSNNSKLLHDFSLRIVQESLQHAISDLGNQLKERQSKDKDEMSEYVSEQSEIENDGNINRLHVAARKVADSFLSNDLTLKLINEGLKEQRELIKNSETPDTHSFPDVASSSISDIIISNIDGKEKNFGEKISVSMDEEKAAVKLVEEQKPKILDEKASVKIDEIETTIPSQNGDIVNNHTALKFDDTITTPSPNNHVLDEKIAARIDNLETALPSDEKIAVKLDEVEPTSESKAENVIDNVSKTATVEDTNSHNSSPNENTQKKKKKKKKKKRRSVQEEGDVSTTPSDTADDTTSTNGFEIIKSPTEDKYSLLLDEQLDVLDRLEGDDKKSDRSQQDGHMVVIDGETTNM